MLPTHKCYAADAYSQSSQNIRGPVYAVLPFYHDHVVDDIKHLLILTMWVVRHVASHTGAATGGHAAALCRCFAHARLLIHKGDSTCPGKAPQRARWAAPSVLHMLCLQFVFCIFRTSGMQVGHAMNCQKAEQQRSMFFQVAACIMLFVKRHFALQGPQT